MKRGASTFVGVLAAAQVVIGVTAARTPVRVQDPENSVKLNVFSPAVKPKAPVYLNTTLANPTEVSVFQIQQTLAFHPEHLRFVRARLGVAGDLAGATLTVELQDGSGAKVDDRDRAQRVQVKVVATRALPTGPLVEYEFRQVGDQEQKLRMRQVAEARDADGKPIAGLVFADPDVTISNTLAPPPLKVLGCFFYMH